jgi:hypothetical protein
VILVTEKALDDLAANQALEKIGMKLGHWHRIEYLDERKQREFYWDRFLASSEGDELNVRELSVLSQKVLDWLPDEGGYVVAFDDSTSLTSDQILILSRIFNGDMKSVVSRGGALLVSFSGRTLEVKLRLSYFIFFCLLFCAHLYIVNAERYEGPILGIQDGAVYLIEFADSRARVDSFLQLLETEKTSYPRWLIEYQQQNGDWPA